MLYMSEFKQRCSEDNQVWKGQIIANHAEHTGHRKLLCYEVPDGDPRVDEDVVAGPHQGSQTLGEFALRAEHETTFLLKLCHLVVDAGIDLLQGFYI